MLIIFLAHGVEYLARPIRRITLHVLLANSPQRRAEALALADITGAGGDAERLEKVAGAAALIGSTRPRLWRRIQRDLPRIVVSDGKSRAEYVPSLKACILDKSFVNGTTGVELASAIVHEATHARLWKAGFRYRYAQRARIEAICTRMEIYFLKACDGAEGALEAARYRQRNPPLTDAQLFDRRLDQLRAAGVPRWMVRAYRALFEPAN